MIRTSCTVAESDVEDALDVLLAALPQGVHEHPAGPGLVELSWWDHGRVDLGALAVTWQEMQAGADRSHHRHPWVVGGRLAVRAPGAPAAPEGLTEIVIGADRGQFGTGAHPTTRDSLEMLLALPAEGSFADLGCGAGVLAVAAARLGFAPVTAVDVEAGSVRMTRENAARNGVEVGVAQVDLLADPPPQAETVAVNVPLRVHRVVAPQLTARRVVASGVVTAEADEILRLYGAYRPLRRADTAGWTTALLERP